MQRHERERGLTRGDATASAIETFVTETAPSRDVSDYTGNLAALDLDTEYRSLKDDPVGSFYVRCLREASTYDRAVGYFRSTVFLVVGPAVIEFARRESGEAM